ncbi:filamentous hemagglutinin [mine drainage metagenome]|uniref:Filamentous hemagglutinin n=1 Tax=mine drainage metagenome TaxID=410659 RepID=A0A1J5R2R8_9ZZZZ
MALSNSTYNSFDHALLLAILISLGLHVLVLAFMPPPHPDSGRIPPALEVVLQPSRPEPPPPPPPKPEPPKPQPRKMLPPPVKAPLPPPAEQPILPPAPPPPQVIATAPVKETEPAFVAPPAPVEPVKPHEPPPADVEADLGKYGNLLAREFAKYKQYPRIAQMRGWQGTVRVKLEVDANGSVTSSVVSESSGFEALDKQALEMAKKASPLPLPPESLRHRPFTITIPVQFRLE